VSKKSSAIDLDTYNELVGNIYDAAMDGSLWSAFLERLAGALNARSGILRVQDLESKEVGMYFLHNLDPWFQQRYKEYFVHTDPLIPAINKLPTGSVIQTLTLMPESFKSTEFFNDFAGPQRMDHAVGVIPVKNQSRIAVLGIHRPDHVGHYQAHEIALLDMLVPHLQRAFQINSYLFQLTDETNATRETLHHLSIGIILVDATGTPVFTNRQAEAIIAEGHGLSITRNGLQASSWVDTQALRKLIFDANKAVQKTGGALAIATPSSSQPLSVLVTPINKENDFGFGIDMPQATAALFIGLAGQQQDFSAKVLNQLYGLTYAEARLAIALANGHSLEKIAEQFKVSKNTIRNQLKSCFQKTGVNRQTELVKLILCGPAALTTNG